MNDEHDANEKVFTVSGRPHARSAKTKARLYAACLRRKTGENYYVQPLNSGAYRVQLYRDPFEPFN